MDSRIVLYLEEDEMRALREDALKSMRPTRIHAHYLLRRALEVAGLLTPQAGANSPALEPQGENDDACKLTSLRQRAHPCGMACVLDALAELGRLYLERQYEADQEAREQTAAEKVE